MDAVTGAYGPHDAHAHAGPTNGKQCSDASANAHACAYVAAQCTGTGTEGAHCLPSEALCRPSPRHPAEGAQHLQEGREASHQRPRDGCQSTWRGAHSVRGGTLGALTAYQHLEGILGRGGQELVRLWQAIRAARRGTTSQDSYGQGTVSGCQGVHGSFQHFSWESSGARAQRRRGPAWGRRGECDADHREHPIAFDLSPTALQGHRIDSDRREGGKTPAIGRIKRGSRSCLAFQLGWLWTTLWCHSRQPDVSDFPATQALKWSHSIMRESTFLCECGAREKAQKLALEIALSCHQVAPSGHFALPPTKKLKSSLHVGFAESTELHIWFEGDIQAQIFCLPADFFDGKSTPWSGCPMVADMKLSRFQVCPWHDGGLVRSCEPLNAQHSRITAPKKVISQYKITDHHFDNPARRLHQEGPAEEPDPDVIPDIQDAPPFAQDLQALADMHQAFANPDGDGILRLRTWYLHHADHLTNFHPRTVELDEDWRRWENDIIGAWRTHLQAGANVFLHLAAPDPYRGYLNRETHGDILITQGNELPRRAGLVTVHYHGGETEPHSYAVACSLELVVSGFRFAEAADAGQWCHLPQNRCTLAYGWQHIPFDHLPRHQMHSGDSITITITRTTTESRSRHSSQLLNEDHHIEVQQHGSDHDYDDAGNFDFPTGTPQPPEASSSSSEQPEDEVGVHIYRLEKSDAHCYLRWDTYRRILLDIVRCLRLPRNDIVGMHFVHALPVGVHPIAGRAVILQSNNDIPAGSGEQLVLIDQEIHFHALPSGLLVPPAFSRKVLRVFPPLHRSQILRLLGLQEYCELHSDKCTIFENNIIWPAQDRTVHALTHGTYLRVIVPPPDDPTLDTEVAIAITRDLTIEEPAPPPPVLTATCQPGSARTGGEGDSSAFFQHALQRHQVTCRSALRALGPSLWKVAPEHVRGHQLPISSDGPVLPPQNPRPLSRFSGRDFDTLNNLFTSQALIECEEEGPIAYIDTWYIHHGRQRQCDEPRAVKIFQDPATWITDILQPWNEEIDHTMDILIYLVRPKPPCTPMECMLAHFIIEQAPRPDWTVALVTIQDASFRGATVNHKAFSISSLMNARAIIRLANMQSTCDARFCSVRRGHIPFDPREFDIVEPGSNLVIFLNAHGPFGPFPRDEEDISHFMQNPAAPSTATTASDAFQFNPNAPHFCPGQPLLNSLPEGLQDLYDHWARYAFSWEGEEASTSVTTWFIDQYHQHLHNCWVPRQIQLTGDYNSWEDTLHRAWQDLRLPGAPILIHVVQPTPPNMGPETAAHVLLIQNPQDTLSSSVVTFFNLERHTDGPTRQFDLTTNEGILLEHLIYGLGLEGRCLLPGATSLCTASSGSQQLLLGRPYLGGDGTGITLWMNRRPAPLETATGNAATNLLQIRARLQQRGERRLTHGQVAHTHGPLNPKTSSSTIPLKIINAGDYTTVLPSFIEVPWPPTEATVASALLEFGVQGKISILSDDHTVLWWSTDTDKEDISRHCVFVSKNSPFECILHTLSQADQEDELHFMRTLYQMGFEKAVILDMIRHSSGILEITFKESTGDLLSAEPKQKTLPPWPAPQVRTPRKPMYQAACDQPVPACCLNCGVTSEDLFNFFQSSKNTLCTSFEGIDLPDFCHERLRGLAAHTHFDRLIIYTDGSSQSRNKHISPLLNEEIGTPDSWSFLVLGETCLPDGDHDLTLIGWSAHQVRSDPNNDWYIGADRIGSAIAEREAICWALLWRIGQNSNIPTVLRSDSMLALQQANGDIGSLVCDTSFPMIRGCAQILEAALGPEGILFDHVPGHAGDPFNEICDQIAKQEGQKGFLLPRPRLHLATWRRLIPFLWLLFGENKGAPTFQGTGFKVQPPDLPPTAVPESRTTHRPRRQLLKFAISIATGNVQSLGIGAQGFTGKLQYLRTQFAAFNLNFMGLQETRSPEGLANKHGILRLSSGCEKGQAGVELWCNLQQPIATANQKQIYLQRKHFLAVHRDPRRLLVRIQHPLWEAWIFVAYAPHSGYSDHDRAQWWSATQAIIQDYHTENSPLFVCLDANAGPGEPDGEHFFQEGFRTSSSTKFLQAFANDFHLCAPITSSIHEGSTCTWTSPSQEEFTIDYVLIPQTWMPHCSFSKILEEFDLGNQQHDHSVYALELSWQGQGNIPTSTQSRCDNFDRSKVKQQMPSHFEDFAIKSWDTNVEDHLQHINDQLHTMLQRHCHRPQRGPERPYVDEHSWKLRKAKLHHRRELKHIRHLLRRESLARVFAAWKHKHAWDGKASFCFGSTLLFWSDQTWPWFSRQSPSIAHTYHVQQESHPPEPCE